MTKVNEHSFGVFKPVGHVVISFPTSRQADAAAIALAALRLPKDAVRSLTDREMLAQIDIDLQHHSPFSEVGQEFNLIKAHRALSQRGYHWLVVRVDGDDQAREVADAVRPFGAERAQLYGRFIIEELIEHPGDLPQVSESPDRALDAQTPTGEEGERAELRPAEPPRRATIT